MDVVDEILELFMEKDKVWDAILLDAKSALETNTMAWIIEVDSIKTLSKSRTIIMQVDAINSSSIPFECVHYSLVVWMVSR